MGMMLKTIMSAVQMKKAGRRPLKSAKALKRKTPTMSPAVPVVYKSVALVALKRGIEFSDQS